MIANWYPPSHWSVGRQWLLLLLSGSLLAGGIALGLFPRWQHYQQLMSETQARLQQIVAQPPTALSPPAQAAVTAAPIEPEAALTRLFQQISRLAEQKDLTLLGLQRPARAYPGGAPPGQLTIEVVGGYQALLTLLVTLKSTLPPWMMDTLLLQREEPINKVKLTLGLALAEPTEDPG